MEEATSPIRRMKHFVCLSEEERPTYYTPRANDIKVGECVELPARGECPFEFLSRARARFVVLGASEDVGIRANAGRGGAHKNWRPFVSTFLNMQVNDFFSAQDVALLGSYEPVVTKEPLTQQVEAIDRALSSLIEAMLSRNMTPLLVGGGHNNAYPLLVGARRAKGKPLSVLNLDAHPDFRALEGRHSGNPFSYARAEGALSKYALLGYQRAYMPQYVLETLEKDPLCWMCSYEEIALELESSFADELEKAIDFVKNDPCGLELDVDAIEGADASASSPSGCSFAQARSYVRWATRRLAPLYFHISEARAIDESPLQATKRIAYLVYDFLQTPRS